MIKKYINILLMWGLALGVYGLCQQDTVLPLTVLIIAVLTLLLRWGVPEQQYLVFEKLPLSIIIIVAFVLGLIWRNIVPIPEAANSPFPEFTAALQSGAVFASLVLWLKPFNQINLYRLVFCVWLVVALAINVPFSLQSMMVFSAFCFVAIAVVILNTMNRPIEKKYFFAYGRDYVVYSALLMIMTTGLFIGISRTVVSFEQAFMNVMSDYVLPRNYTHFLNLSSKLSLISPGLSAFDKRPVLEVRLPKSPGVYLRMQVFDRYENGTWQEVKPEGKRLLPETLSATLSPGTIVMFTSLKDTIPAPSGIVAAKGRSAYFRSEDQILYAENQQHTHVVDFGRSAEPIAVTLSAEQMRRYTAVPSSISSRLAKIAQSIVADEKDVMIIAPKMVEYFRANFSYSLDMSFSADDKGLIKMLEEKKPAYCTYFASALTLLLRTQGIPARVVDGFMTNELVDQKKNIFLARVKDAHAWTEVLVTIQDPKTGQNIQVWQPLDATPSSVAAGGAGPSGINFEKMFEHLWLAMLRFNAQIENMDKNKLKLGLVVALICVVAFLNRDQLVSTLRGWRQWRLRLSKPPYKTSRHLHMIYQQYEQYLKSTFAEVRQPANTDAEVIQRIKEKFPERITEIARAQTFVRDFQAARFGNKMLEKFDFDTDEDV